MKINTVDFPDETPVEEDVARTFAFNVSRNGNLLYVSVLSLSLLYLSVLYLSFVYVMRN